MAYALTEAGSGSDSAAMRTTARRDGDEYVLNGTKAWTTHGGRADFYKVMARTSEDRNGISCFLVPGDVDGLTADHPEHKMGMTGSPTATMSMSVLIHRDWLASKATSLSGMSNGIRWSPPRRLPWR